MLASSGQAWEGRTFDISMSGVSVMLENRIVLKETYTLHIRVFKNGEGHDFTVAGRCVHASLVGDRGFKHGFEFASPSAAAQRAIAALTESSFNVAVS